MPQVFRPSSKFIKAGYVVVTLVFFIAVWGWYQFIPEKSAWLLVIPALLFFIPLRMQVRQMAIKLTLEADHLILETGLLSKTTRTINIAKVQDVTVRQSISQRMYGIGDVTVESAGEGSSMTAHNFDQPKRIADLILKAAHLGASGQASGKSVGL